MTVSASLRRAGPYACTGAQTAFPFYFKVFSAGDVVVTKTDPTPLESILTLTADYTVSLNADQDASPGGTVSLVAAPAAGFLITLSSSVAASQSVVLTNQGGFYPAVINNAMDRLTILIQQLDEKVGRAVLASISNPGMTPQQMIAQINTAVSAAAASAAAAAASGIVAWVSGATYGIGDKRWSPANYRIYSRKTVGAGTVDPSLDPANWTLIGASTQWTIKTAAYTAIAGDAIQADTTGSAFTLTLPASPASNDLLRIADYAGTFATNNLTVGRNGSNIMGLAEDMVISTNNISITLQYIDATQGWRIV